MKVKFFTLGCKVNQYETRCLQEQFLSCGHTVASGAADLYVINTCTVTKQADRKSKAAVLRAKKENPKAKIAVCGCLAQFNRPLIESWGVDYIVPQDEKPSLVSLVLPEEAGEPCLRNSKSVWSLKLTDYQNQRALVKVQDGCDNFCSFCKIPHIRGKSISRPKPQIIREIKALSPKHREVVLCGINLGLYGKDLKPALSLEQLVKDILDIPQLGRLRLSSLEPCLISNKLLLFLRNNKFCPHLHLPFQYGEDSILAKMNKKETVGLYEEKIARARKINKDVAISCDIMIGFPGETNKTFKSTVDFLKVVRPMRMHIFSFSPRDKTKFMGTSPMSSVVVRKRYGELKALADDFSYSYAKGFKGKILNMIPDEIKNGLTSGYTENYIKVCLKGKVPLGEIIPVKIKEIKSGKVFVSLA
ncbi:MAG: MiaB/RimO family radical SAM methylthiotransferase [Candidatus Omnitrophica bacterium]|nr:MiaB/RimO family radical SAM methylthiotransferase [Candidatus Omnitrophota bacterium]